MTAEPAPSLHTLGGPFGFALTVDVEEWYHTCHVPEYVRPERRPRLAEPLERQLPGLLERLAESGRSATFFVLGEVAQRLPQRVREIAAAGHEVASHSTLHLRAGWQTPAEFERDVRGSKALLEDLIGLPVRGFRAPEWSLRRPQNPRLEVIAALGFDYDSSLTPSFGAGRLDNPVLPTGLEWPSGRRLREYPPLTFGGRLRLPAGGFAGRLAPPEWIVRAARRLHAAGGLPVMVVHPWELVADPTPGDLTGFARFVHDTGRPGYGERFRDILRELPWTSIVAADLQRAPTAMLPTAVLPRTPPLPRP